MRLARRMAGLWNRVCCTKHIVGFLETVPPGSPTKERVSNPATLP